MFTTLVAQKALAGTRKSKATLRKREDLIEKCGIAVRKLLRYTGFARGGFCRVQFRESMEPRVAFICKAQAILGRQVRLRLERTVSLAL